MSKHADYTFFYAAQREPVPGDVGVVVMLELVTGRVRRMDGIHNGAKPSPDFHCHESPNSLEFYVWDNTSSRVPPAGCCRAVPRWEVRWQAFANDRARIAHDGMGQLPHRPAAPIAQPSA